MTTPRPCHDPHRLTRTQVSYSAPQVHQGKLACPDGAWWVYCREDDKPVRRHVGPNEQAAERIAEEVKIQLSAHAPTLFTFLPVSISDLRDRFLKYHQEVLGSSVATANRYRTATQYLVDYVASLGRELKAQDMSVTAFVTFIRQRLVSPNGHRNTKKRKLRGKGLRFVLEVCRSLYAFAAKSRHLPPYAANPFTAISRIDAGGSCMRIVSSQRFMDGWSFINQCEQRATNGRFRCCS